MMSKYMKLAVWVFIFLFIPLIGSPATPPNHPITPLAQENNLSPAPPESAPVQSVTLGLDPNFKVVYFKPLGIPAQNMGTIIPAFFSSQDASLEQIQTLTGYSYPHVTEISCYLPGKEELEHMVQVVRDTTPREGPVGLQDPNQLIEIGIIQNARKTVYSLRVEPFIA
jgi:hypothetical protein